MRVLIPCLVLILAAPAPAQEGEAGPDLLQGVHEMRVRLENDRAVAEQRAQQSTLHTTHAARSALPGIGEMRRELRESLDRVEIDNQCLDVDVEGNQGNLILICGDTSTRNCTGDKYAFRKTNHKCSKTYKAHSVAIIIWACITH